MSGTERRAIHPGRMVDIVQKKDQRSGVLTRGVVQDILTRSSTHPHGIKVRLETGEVGRVKRILTEEGPRGKDPIARNARLANGPGS